jgi:glycosyltransferase involved in cell wall biosynthesis
MKKIAVFSGSDLRNYGGGEKDIIGWTSRLASEIDITVYTPDGRNGSFPRVTREFLLEQMNGVNLKYYHGVKSRLLKDIIPLQRFNLREYDKVYSYCQGFLLNRELMRTARKFLFGVHVQSTLDDRPIEDKAWKLYAFKAYRMMQMHYVHKFPEIRVQNSDDYKRLQQIGYRGKIWTVPPRMFDTTPRPRDCDKFYVVWVNRIAPEKRPEELVKIAQQCPDVEFHVIGSGRAAGIFDGPRNIKVKGFLSDAELSEELSGASAYVSTSRGENFGMSCVEAAAHGVPTIAYDVMGLRDYASKVVKDAWHAALAIHGLYWTWLDARGEYMVRRNMIRESALKRFSDAAVLPRIKEMVTE